MSNEDTPSLLETSSHIGVGMGGSCPSCRAPVELGQEFCLECGAAIRFVGKPKDKRRTRLPADSIAPHPSSEKKFPWVPFLIVLGLIIAAVVVAVTDNGPKSSTTHAPKATTEPALPSITNSTTQENTPSTQSDTPEMTVTVDECPTDNNSTTPSSANALDATDDETIPELAPASPGLMGDNDPNADTFPSSDDTTSTLSTVDRNGMPCDNANTSTNNSATDPLATTPPTNSTTPSPDTPVTSPSTTASTAPTSNTPSNTVTSWPDKDGWTVIVAGYPDQNRANQSAATVQEDGFESGVLFSSDYGSLCPGFYVVFSGVFETEAQAKNQERRLRGKYQSMYVRKIAKNGQAPNCKTQ